jgi:hypothetical protein
MVPPGRKFQCSPMVLVCFDVSAVCASALVLQWWRRGGLIGDGRFLKEVDVLCSGGGSSSIALRQLQQLVDTAAAAAMQQASTGGALLA